MEFLNPNKKILKKTDKLALFAKGIDFSPTLVEISPTNDCNAKCDWCFYVSSSYKQHHSKEEIEKEIMIKTLEELTMMGVPAINWTGGGDPSVYSSIDEMSERAKTLGLKQGIFTNAYRPLKHPEFFEWIRITITEKFLITKHVKEYAKVTKTGINFNLTPENQIHLEELVIDAKEKEVHYFQIRPALADRADLQKPVVPIEELSFLKKYESPSFKILFTDYKWDDYMKPHGYPLCYGHHFVPFIWHNGDVSVCAYHFGKEDFVFGNLRDNSFKEVWDGYKRKEMIDKGIPVIKDCQHCCKNHEINKVLYTIKNEEIEDGDFL